MLSHAHFPAIMRAVPHARNAASAPLHDELYPLTAIFGKFPTMEEVEEYLIAQALKMTQGKTGAAASLLGVSRQGLHKRIKPGKSDPEG
jgi:transcriptional regulator of acetoin/glycerol metabolism